MGEMSDRFDVDIELNIKNGLELRPMRNRGYWFLLKQRLTVPENYSGLDHHKKSYAVRFPLQ
jgi:hypothetical protein